MLLKRFTQYVLSSRSRAVFMAMLFMVLPFFSWVSAVIVALVTLRKGIYEGFLIVLWTALPFVVLFVVEKEWVLFVRLVLLGSLLVWLLAIVFRRYAKWSLILELSALFGILGVLIVHILIPNVDTWWVNHVVALTKTIAFPIDETILTQVIQMMAPYATGLSALFILISGVTELIIGRGLVSQFEKGKKFIQEWVNIRLSVIAALILIFNIVMIFKGPVIFKDFLPLTVLPFIFAGISFVHLLLIKWHVSRKQLILFYVIVMVAVIFFPVLLSLLVMISFADSFINFRARMIVTE